MRKEDKEFLKEFLLVNSMYQILNEVAENFFKDIIAILQIGTLISTEKSFLEKPTKKQEGNVITAFCFRNTLLEDVHAGLRLDNQVMKQLMIESSNKVTNWINMKEKLLVVEPKIYYLIVNIYKHLYTKEWNED